MIRRELSTAGELADVVLGFPLECVGNLAGDDPSAEQPSEGVANEALQAPVKALDAAHRLVLLTHPVFRYSMVSVCRGNGTRRGNTSRLQRPAHRTKAQLTASGVRRGRTVLESVEPDNPPPVRGAETARVKLCEPLMPRGEWRNGRRARFRSVCPKGREGSTPSSPTRNDLPLR